MIIYKTTNLINGKFYVGKDERNKPDYFGSGINLQRAIKKYGKENFIKETLEFCSTREELIEREKYWIKETKAQELGYNIADGGWGGNTMCEENRERIINGFKGKKHTLGSNRKRKETREKRKQENSDAYKLSEEHKQILSKTHKGKVHTPEWRKRQSEVMRKYYYSENSFYSEKWVENQKGENKKGEKSPMWDKKASEETKRKQSEAHKKNPVRYWLGKKQSPETIKKKKETMEKRKKENPEKYEELKQTQRIKMLGERNPFYGQTHTPETRKRLKQARLNKTSEEMLEIYIKFHITKKGYEPGEEQKQKKLEEYKNKRGD